MKQFITSDQHYGHKSILIFNPKRLKDDGSEFKTIQEHDNYLIEKYNSIVSNNDLVYHLGDFAYKCNKNYAESIFWRLNGRKILIIGNHDSRIAKKFINCWEEVHELLRIEIVKSNGFKQKVLLSHRPFLSWERSCIHLHGHTHGKIEHLNKDHFLIRKDIGVDTNNLYPYDLEELINNIT
jgi:calcineurin-like phosphoesterase family protein